MIRRRRALPEREERDSKGEETAGFVPLGLRYKNSAIKMTSKKPQPNAHEQPHPTKPAPPVFHLFFTGRTNSKACSIDGAATQIRISRERNLRFLSLGPFLPYAMLLAKHKENPSVYERFIRSPHPGPCFPDLTAASLGRLVQPDGPGPSLRRASRAG
jgi:hypothetical protein